MELRIADYRKILTLLDDLGRARDLASFMRSGVAGLHRLVPAEAISFHEIWFRQRSDGRPHDLDVRIYHEEPYVDWGDSDERAEDLTYPLCLHHSGQHMLRRLSDAVPSRELRGGEYYQELMRPYGREFEWKLALPSPAGTCRAFTATRQTRDYSDSEMSALAAVHPHLVHAFSAVRDRALAERALAALEGRGGFERLGILLLGTDERIEAAAGAALSLIETYVGRENGHLPVALESWVREQRRRSLAPEVGLPPEPFVVERGERRLTLRFLQDVDGGKLLLEEQVSRRPAPDDSYRLTDRQFEVLRCVGEGLTNKEAARRLEITSDTVRKHLENAYTKLGVGTRTAAVARALGRDSQ